MSRAAKSGIWIMLNPVLFPLRGGVIATCSSFFYAPTNCKSAFTEMVSLAVALNWTNYASAQAVALTFKNPCSFASVRASYLIYHILPARSGVMPLPPPPPALSAWPSSTRLSIKLPYVPMAPYFLCVQICPRRLLLLPLVIHCSFFFLPYFSGCFDAYVVIYTGERVTGKT